MRKLFVTIITLSFLSSGIAKADCLPLYRQKIQAIDARMTGFKTTLVTTAVSEAALVATLILATGSVAIGSVAMMPATMVGAGSYLTFLAVQKNQYEKAYNLIRQAQAGGGKRLAKSLNKINKKLEVGIESDELEKMIIEANEMEIFCKKNVETEKIELFSYFHLMKYLKGELTL